MFYSLGALLLMALFIHILACTMYVRIQRSFDRVLSVCVCVYFINTFHSLFNAALLMPYYILLINVHMYVSI